MKKIPISKISLLIGSAIVAITLYGCGDNNKVTEPTTSSATSAEQVTANSIVNLDKKLTIYIKCYNASRTLDSFIERYARWIKDKKADPSAEEKIIFGLYNVNHQVIADCKTRIAEVAALPPVTELDEVALVFTKDIEKLMQLVSELYPYYKQQDYKHDDFKKGKALNTTFVQTASDYLINVNRFANMIDAENDKRQIAQLAELQKKEGQAARYYRLAIMVQTKQMANMLYIDNFSLDEMKQWLDDYNKTIEAASAYVTDPNHKEVMAKMGASAEVKLRVMIKAANEFQQTAKARYQSIRDKKPIKSSSADTAANTMGTVENIQVKYNQLVGAFNR